MRWRKWRKRRIRGEEPDVAIEKNEETVKVDLGS